MVELAGAAADASTGDGAGAAARLNTENAKIEIAVSATTISSAPRQQALRRLRIAIRGTVQGVGFRPFVYRLAREMGLCGWVSNSGQGVFIEVDGDDSALGEFASRLEHEKPAISSIHSLEAAYLDPVGFSKFEIRISEGGEKTALILPDVATCLDCLREISNPADRRFRYPFTNCTNCGPRFTIIEALPYDRSRTSMKKFAMCELCSREYYDPSNRRFHAQPNACPVCGPHLELWDHCGALIAERHDALLACAQAIREGKVVAVKGLGGFHLMADARDEQTVRQLRTRKRREEKPFALLFPDFNAIIGCCEVSQVEERLLRSPELPIVLLRRCAAGDGVARSIAPRNPYLGVMLPYTPLHHLLTRELGFPVVATSGNLSDEPICTDEREALLRLAGIADLFLVHDRPIVRHVDDSIVREMMGRGLVLRRARGFAPLPVRVSEELPPLVAIGAHQKNAIAASVGQHVFVSQHVGDLETEASFAAFRNVIQAFLEMYELNPVAVACDLHPDYVSTRYASAMGPEVMPVQHHHAHVLSCMAENELQGPVLGVSWDGSGFGPDGTVWGGEFLHVEADRFDRLAHLRTFRLPGGDKAVREPRRAALAVLYEIFGNEAFVRDSRVLRAFSDAEARVLHAMLQGNVNSPMTSSAGRLFDAVASLAGLRQICHFEGQAAMELEYAIVAGEDDAYPFKIHAGGSMPMVADWAPMIVAMVADQDPAIGNIARRFHNTLVHMIADVAQRIGEPKVVLTGGCFQNAYLAEACIRRLQGAGFQVYWHQRVPPNDGGIALGQIAGAAATLRQRRKE